MATAGRWSATSTTERRGRAAAPRRRLPPQRVPLGRAGRDRAAVGRATVQPGHAPRRGSPMPRHPHRCRERSHPRRGRGGPVMRASRGWHTGRTPAGGVPSRWSCLGGGRHAPHPLVCAKMARWTTPLPCSCATSDRGAETPGTSRWTRAASARSPPPTRPPPAASTAAACWHCPAW